MLKGSDGISITFFYLCLSQALFVQGFYGYCRINKNFIVEHFVTVKRELNC